MKPYSLKVKLLAPVILMAFVSIAYFGYISLSYAGDRLREGAASKLTALANFHKMEIERYFHKIEHSVSTLASSVTSIQAMHDFEEAVYFVDSSLAMAMEILKSRDSNVDAVTDARGLYIQARNKYHTFFASFMTENRLGDMMLIEPESGYIIYSANKVPEFGQYVIHGPLRKTGIGLSVYRALADQKALYPPTEFSSYQYRKGTRSSFLTRPIVDGGDVAGVMTVRISMEQVKALLEKRLGMDGSFIIWLASKDGSKIAASGPWREELPAIEPGREGVFGGLDGAGGVQYLRAQTPLDIDGMDYTLIVDTPLDLALAPLGSLKLSILFFVLLSLVVLGGAHLMLGASVIGPLKILGEAMKQTARSGRSPEKALPENSSDEIGSLYHLFNDLGRKLEQMELEGGSKNRSLNLYTDSLSEKIERLEEELDSTTAALEQSHAASTKMENVIRRQEKSLETQRKKLNATRKYLEELDETRDRFLEIAGHELKEKASLLSRSVAAESDGSGNDNLLMILNETRALERLIDKALASFSLELHDRPLLADTFDMAELARDTTEGMTDLASRRNVKLVFKSGADSIPVQAEKESIRITMENLLENALKNTLSRGTVMVSVNETGSMARFEVCDTGKGIEKKLLGKIFNRYFRIESSSADDPGGMGLGLFICLMIIRRHDGKIGAESEQGKGSVFFFELPKQPIATQNVIPGLEI